MIATKSKASPKRLTERRWTFDEVAAELPETAQPTELWDGELVMAPAPSPFHQRSVGQLFKFLDDWVQHHHLGEVFVTPIDMVLAPHRSTQPDVVFIANDRLGIIQQQIRGPADLVAEVISPTSRRRDRIDKRDLYEQHGVKEYWLIDPEAETVEVLFLQSGQYRLLGRWRPGEAAGSRLLKGFSVPVDKLFKKED